MATVTEKPDANVNWNRVPPYFKNVHDQLELRYTQARDNLCGEGAACIRQLVRDLSKGWKP